MIFVTKAVSRIAVEGGIFGSARNIWGNPYCLITSYTLTSSYLFTKSCLLHLGLQSFSVHDELSFKIMAGVAGN